jgi:hypothetical protein
MSDLIKDGERPRLGNTMADRTAALARSLAGSAPIAGPFLAELITAIIPNQRLDRVEAFLFLLAAELDRLGASPKATLEASIPLVEEGIAQATRAFTDERRQFLARCVAHGIAADELGKLQELKILRILGELGDDDLLLLDANNERNGWTKLEAIRPPFASLSASDEVHVRHELYRASYRKLEALGLLNFSMSKGEYDMPQYDHDGQLKGHHYVSSLGRMVLQRVGLTGEEGQSPAPA